MSRGRFAAAIACVAIAAGAAGFHVRSLVRDDAGKEYRLDRLSLPDFEDVDGDSYTLPVGERPFLLNFWATWCPPCIKELPLLDAASKRCPAGSVVGLAADEPEASRELARRLGLSSMDNAIGERLQGFAVMEALGNHDWSLPLNLMVDADGAVAARHELPFESTAEIIDFMGQHGGVVCDVEQA